MCGESKRLFFFIFSSENEIASFIGLLSKLCSSLLLIATDGQLLESELLREFRQVAAAAFGDDHEVLDADATGLRVVETRLYCHHVTGDELLVSYGDAGSFVDLQSYPVAGTVDKAS